MLGAIFAILSAAAFALNNATMRRGVVTGTPLQAMAVSVPLGVVCFVPVVWLTSGLSFAAFSTRAVAWLAGLGVLHFIVGRYCNFRANAEAGVNLTAPVVQLQVVVTMVLAVVILHEPCTALQMIGGALVLVGSIVTQRAPAKAGGSAAALKFEPRYVAGYEFAALAAVAYGTTPVMARFALEGTDSARGVLGGLISYIAATAVMGLAMVSPAVRANVVAVRWEAARWFVWCGLFVAAAQGFFFAAIAIAPVMLVMPLLQLSLAFRMLFSTWLNPEHEVTGPLVLAGVAISVVGALLVSIDSALIVQTLHLPGLLLWRV